MALPTYPPALPSPSPLFKAFERGQNNYIFVNQTATAVQTGTAAPAGAVVFAMPPSSGVENGRGDITVQLDAFGTPAAVVHIYGSNDGVNFYDMLPAAAALQTAGTYGLFFLSKLIAQGVKVRFITAGVTAYAGSGGTTDSITISIYA